MNNSIFIMAGYDIDTGSLHVMFSDGSTASYYIPDYEDTLDTTMITRSQLDRLMEEDVFSYAHLMITGRMQEYLDGCAGEFSDLRRSIEENLRKTDDDATAAYLAREFMRYES